MSQFPEHVDIAIIGAGSVGIAVAYYLAREHGLTRAVLIDCRDPMSLTSAHSGENYRNWWPHPVMTAFTDHSIDLMEQLDRETGGRLNMTRGGYALVTRRKAPQDLIDGLHRIYDPSSGQIRFHESGQTGYRPPLRAPWTDAPGGVDVLLSQRLIRETFPSFAPDVETVVHIRRAGSIDSQQMGQAMLERLRAAGVTLLRAEVKGITSGAPFVLELAGESGVRSLRADRIVNAAGPFIGDIAAMLGESVPVKCVYQQKIAFPDRERAVPRDLPFTIDVDPQTLAWSAEDSALLAGDPATRHLVEPMDGNIHCRPDGPVDGNWIKLGWAYNRTASDPHDDEPIDRQFPDTVLRGASRLQPKLAAYVGRLPRDARHYGGYYAMTNENWPLIGRMKTPGAFIAGALSGFGSMTACAAGALTAAWVAGKPIPAYARSLSSDRYTDPALAPSLGKGEESCL